MRIQELRRTVGLAVRRFVRLGRGQAPTARQTAVTLATLAAMYSVSSVRTGAYEVPGPGLTSAMLAAWAPLLVRTARPALALLGTLAAETCILVLLTVPDSVARASEGMGAYQPVPMASMVAVATLASRVPRATGWGAGAAAGAYLAIVGLMANGSETYLTDLVVFYLVVNAAACGVWLSGRRERVRREVQERETQSQQAVLDERLRIARELHDVLAHNLTLVNAQAGVARYLLRSGSPRADQALHDITQHTARAIDDLRATIGLLREREDTATDEQGLRPVPGLADLDELLATVSSTGTTVELSETGERVPLVQHVDMAAYRILQESLTNASKHAPDAAVAVGITWSAAGVRLKVTNAFGGVDSRPAAPGTGHGLIGMRERAHSVGGTIRTGPTTDSQFEVVAMLPAVVPTPFSQS